MKKVNPVQAGFLPCEGLPALHGSDCRMYRICQPTRVKGMTSMQKAMQFAVQV